MFIEIRGVENGELVVHVIIHLCTTWLSLATDTWPCVLIIWARVLAVFMQSITKLLVNMYSCHVIVKSASCCCVHGSQLFSNLVTCVIAIYVCMAKIMYCWYVYMYIRSYMHTFWYVYTCIHTFTKIPLCYNLTCWYKYIWKLYFHLL